MISLRIKTIGSLINNNSKVIDVGCDHGLLDVYLAFNKDCDCLATDISDKCLEKAKRNIKRYNLEDRIKTKVTDGLSNICYNKYDYVVICGMGYNTIVSILKDKYPKKIIIQCNNNLRRMKKFLFKKYKLVNEFVVFENNIFYNIMYLEKGKKHYSYVDYVIGYQRNNIDYLKYMYSKNASIYKNLSFKHLKKKFVLLLDLIIIKKYLKKHQTDVFKEKK